MLTVGGGSGGYKSNLIPTLSRMHGSVRSSGNDASKRLTSLKRKTATPGGAASLGGAKLGSSVPKVGGSAGVKSGGAALGAIGAVTRPGSSGGTGSGLSGSVGLGSGSYGASPASMLPSPTSAAGSTTVNNWVDSMKAAAQKNAKFDNSATEKAVEKLRKQLYSGPSAPKLPGQINLDNYQTELATIDDISKKYGFDYSREYAERQAAILAQAQRDEVEAARARSEYETESAQTDLEHDFFQQYLEQRQALVDSGLNAGIASERDLRLEMNRQYALADILANQQLYNQELDANMQRISAEELTYAEKLFQERMQQGFSNAMDVSRFNQSENQWQANMAMQQRQQQVEEAWRAFEFNNMSEADKQRMLQNERQFGTEMAWRQYEFENMSAAERARLAADAEKFGMDMAWQRHKFEAGMAFEAGQSGFTNGSGGGGAAAQMAQQMGLRVTSTTRTPEENKRVGGHPKSSHLTGKAMDIAGSKAQMDAYANWARNSGLFKNVLWQVPGHYDHVHVDW